VEGKAALATRLRRGVVRSLGSSTEVVFYEWCGKSLEAAEDIQFRLLGVNHLADAAAQYSEDPPTLNRLLRYAQRLRSGLYQVAALIDAQGRFLHFACSTGLNQFFLSEWDSKINGLAQNAVVIFDGWTPSSQADRGYAELGLELIASQAKAKEQFPWTFIDAERTLSPLVLEKAGFLRRFTIIRRRILGWQWVTGPPGMEAQKSPKAD
jgi:hypothetical protein